MKEENQIKTSPSLTKKEGQSGSNKHWGNGATVANIVYKQ